MQLGFPAALSCVMCHRQGLDQEGEPLLDLPYVRIGLSEQSQTIRPKHLGPCGTPDCAASAHPRKIVPCASKTVNLCSVARAIPASARSCVNGPSRRN